MCCIAISVSTAAPAMSLSTYQGLHPMRSGVLLDGLFLPRVDSVD